VQHVLAHADVLEADVAQAERPDQVEQFEAVLDGPVVPGQHENEVHRRVPPACPACLERACLMVGSML
jgi:hypothetical protein